MVLLGAEGFSPPAAALDLTEQVSHCRTVTEPAERLACYDALPVASDPQPQSAAAMTRPGSASADPAALFGLDATARSQALELQAGRSTPESIEAVVAETQVRPDRRLELRLDNGQRWVQTESVTLPARPGDRVRIREAALGSFLLQRNGTGRGFRVRRLDGPAD